MKKLISFMMVFTILLSIALPVAYAQENSKIDSGFLSLLDIMDDNDRLQVWIFIYDTINEDEVVQKTFEKCGLTKATAKTQEEVDLYLSTYRNIKAEMCEAHNKEVFAKMNVPDEDIIFFSTLTPSFILEVTKAKVFEISQIPEVASIDFYKLPIIPQPDQLFEARFLEIYGDDITSSSHSYKESYYHYDENGEIDWALIYECSYNSPPWEYHGVYKDRILMYGDYSPFCFGYGIYDVKNDKFLDVFDTPNIFDKYEGLEEVLDAKKLGYPFGDADMDKELTILDATFIQRALADLCDFEYEDRIEWYYGYRSWSDLGYPKYISDFDRDGERTIMDATTIQKALVRS